ncbi:MAG TPA: DUF4234 domain-containing protein [Gaiellaceae bacterium]|jgi:hypothetical protein
MAESLSVRGVDVKIRHPWGVFALALVTLGIYYVVWYYKTNRELADYGRAVGRDLGDSPLVSVLAITIGWIIIVPPFVSMFRYFGRIAQAEEAAGFGEQRDIQWIGLALYVVAVYFLPLELPYAQSELNRLWGRERGSTPVPAAGA